MKKTILVTGASSGLGKDFVKRAISNGMKVYAVARHLDQMEDIKGLGAITLKMDISKSEDIKSVIKKINEEEPNGIDILINNAGFGLYGAIEDVSMEEAKYQFNVNVFGLAELTKEVLPIMKKNNKGTIINISSIGGKMCFPFGCWYHASKHAIEAFSDCLRMEIAKFNIKVVIIEPGIIRTGFSSIAHSNFNKFKEKSDYKIEYDNLATSMKKVYSGNSPSSPKVITDIIFNKVLKAKKPKARYHGGSMSNLTLFLKKVLSDKSFDKAALSRVSGK